MRSLPLDSSQPDDQLPAEDGPELWANAVALRDRGEMAQAIATFERALASDPAFAEGWLELGTAHMLQGSLAQAIAAYERAIALDPSLGEAQANLALAYREQGRPEEAIAAYRAALALDPADVEALQDLGLLLQEQECWAEATEALRQAQALAPSPALLLNLADLLLRQQDHQGAVVHYRQALACLSPSENEALRAELQARLGVALHQLGQLEEAVQAYGEALHLRPGWTEMIAHRNTALEQLKGAVQRLRQAVAALPPTDAEGRAQLLAQLGVALHRLGCLPEAIASYEQALALAPSQPALPSLRDKAMEQGQNPALLSEIASRLNLLALYDAQLQALRQAAALAPTNTEKQLDLALALLRCGHFEEGWPLYEARLQAPSPQGALPRWQPGLACERLLIVPPKDLGDQLMFASLLPDAASLTPQQVLRIDPRLQTLFARSFPHLQLLHPGQPIDPRQPCQAQIAMGSLAAHLRPSTAHFLASRRAYLQADAAKTQALRRRHLPSTASGDTSAPGDLLVGLCWRSASKVNGGMKSIPLHTLAGALALPGVRLLSLQYGDTSAEREELLRTTGLEVHADPEIDTFDAIDDLAALIAACDVIVSVSNASAHLAGALGQPTWLLIDSRLDWRWGLTGSDTLWYPNARIFRQPAAGDWATPLAAIRQELEAWQAQGSQWQHRPVLPMAGVAPPPAKWVF